MKRPDDWVIGEASNICHPERPRVEQRETRGSRRIPTMPVLGNAASGSSRHTLNVLLRGFKSAGAALRAVLREIFDESAYDRFLLRTQRQSSIESYRAFMIERDAAAVTKQRCC
jgi:hypothetical protein